MASIRAFRESDWPGVWRILEPVFRAGRTYAIDIDITEDAARDLWIAAPTSTFVSEGEQGEVLGTYYIKPNHHGPGGHVCNCGYVVAASARGQGVATAMCEHSQARAVQLGFRAMQFNLVVSTNRGAVRLWETLGFETVGRLPGAFRHPDEGFVDALVMYKQLPG